MFLNKILLRLRGQTRENLGESSTEEMELKDLKKQMSPHFELIIDINYPVPKTFQLSKKVMQKKEVE